MSTIVGWLAVEGGRQRRGEEVLPGVGGGRTYQFLTLVFKPLRPGTELGEGDGAKKIQKVEGT